MSDVIKFALLGLGSSAVITLLASGIVVIYRGSGVVNFAQGSFAIVGGYTYFELNDRGVPVGLSVVVSVALAALCGLVTELVVMWPMRRSSPLARIVATLAIVVIVSKAVQIRYGDTLQYTRGILPSRGLHIADSIILPEDRIWLLGIGIAITIALWAIYRWSRFGLATSASAEDQDAAAALGWSPRTIAAANWTIGAGLAGVAGVLFVALNGVSQEALALAIIPALSAALIGSFGSFPLTLLGALIVGIVESETTRFVSTPGWNVVGPFVVIVVILVVRNRALPERSFLSDRLPRVGIGRISPTGTILGLAVIIGSLYLFSSSWSQAVTISAIGAIICLSLVVVTGYAGQISLAQFSLAGVGALISSRVADAAGVPFFWAVALGVLLTIPVGVLVAMPALRARGLNLAVVTLGFATVIDSAVLSNVNWTGGLLGTEVKPPTLFGLHVDSSLYPQRYAMVCVVAFAITALLVANIRRGRCGRLLLAVRENERAAASLGISTFGPKIFGFGVGAGIAGLAGGLSAFQFASVDFAQFSPLVDMNFVMLIVIGGLGYLAGATTAGMLAVAGIGEVIVDNWIDVTDIWQLLLGVLLLVQLIFTPDGIARQQVDAIGRVRQRMGWSRVRETTPSPSAESAAVQVRPRVLELRDIVVEFGGTRALNGVSVSVNPGEVVGLIGPNGAGKTTLIDAATGFAKVRSGNAFLDGKPIDGLSPQQRARLGLSRSWQSQELFSAMTVEENLRAAAEPGGAKSYLLEPLWPRRTALPVAARAVVEQFELQDVLSSYPDSLPYAVRRLVGIGRAVAATPSVLLLDEPTAGLDETSTREFGELIRRLARDWNMGILLIEHDVALVMRVCDRVLAIDFGTEITSGPAEEVRAHPRVIEAYLGGQHREPADVTAGPQSAGELPIHKEKSVSREVRGRS
jgi:ABC-type branched-subunit amino acid transport system ATPase component/ABC-type branched-subunit amino acid transport system permease subunit